MVLTNIAPFLKEREAFTDIANQIPSFYRLMEIPSAEAPLSSPLDYPP
tara:strand:- start:28 stop:171 length:144 start_codon:yes stop_codon:yes gene_type:complete